MVVPAVQASVAPPRTRSAPPSRGARGAKGQAMSDDSATLARSTVPPSRVNSSS